MSKEELYFRDDGYLNASNGTRLVTALDRNGHAVAIYTAYKRSFGYELYIRKPLNGRTPLPKIRIGFRDLSTKENIERWVRKEGRYGEEV